MNKTLFAAALMLATCSFAHAAEGTTVASLKGECAAMHNAKLDVQAMDANEYHFVYSKGEYKGEAQPGQALPCTENQYVAYLDTIDPTRVMEAYPTAAGRPVAKDASKK